MQRNIFTCTINALTYHCKITENILFNSFLNWVMDMETSNPVKGYIEKMVTSKLT